MTGGVVAASVLQREAIAAILNGACVVATTLRPFISLCHCRVESKRDRMRRMKYALIGLLGVVLLFAQSGLAYTARRVVCSQTGKVVSVQCCCSVKDGKFICSFTNKSFEKCCCESR